MAHYYNEFDDAAASWLEELIFAGEIPYGIVDRRSIEDVTPADLAGYTQCHFFAGIGGWPLALRLAGLPEDREIWTGSCPCQPFSTAGAGAGFADERHLWPAFYWLISQRRPPLVVGEQVASAAAGPWLDLVQADVEGVDYAFGSVAFPAAGIGAPHIRDRTYWVANARSAGSPEQFGRRIESSRSAARDAVMWLGHADGLGAGRDGRSVSGPFPGKDGQHLPQHAGAPGAVGGLADSEGVGRREERADAGRFSFGDRAQGLASGFEHGGGDRGPGPVNGFWTDADWLGCRDGRWRPVEPGAFPLAHGLPARVGRLRGYGNAIVPQQAAEFIKAALM